MELIPNARVPDGLLATMMLLREKPHQGVPRWESAPHQGIGFVISSTVIDFQFRCSKIVSGTVVAPNNSICASCHLANYHPPKQCDVQGQCTPQEKAQWCAAAYKMAELGTKATGGGGATPAVVGGAGILTRYLQPLDEVIGGPLAVLGAAGGMAAYTTNYVDSVCKVP
jgi:hypothetical protein